MQSKQLATNETAPKMAAINPMILGSENTRKSVCNYLHNKISTTPDLSLRTIGKLMTPNLSPAQLSRLLAGKSPFCITRISQLAMILGIRIQELFEAVTGPSPSIEKINFTDDQRDLLLDNPFHYILLSALRVPRSLQEIEDLFPEKKNEISLTIADLEKHRLVVVTTSHKYQCAFGENHYIYLGMGEKYTRLIKEIYGQGHDSVQAIAKDHPDLVPFIRDMLLVSYLTPDQMNQLRVYSMEIKKKLSEFERMNTMDPAHRAQSLENLCMVATMVAPLNGIGFVKRARQRGL